MSSTTTGLDDAAADIFTGPSLAARGRHLAFNVVLYALAFAAALGLSAILVVVATDASVASVFTTMYDGSLRDGAALGLTIDNTVPVLIVALGAVIASQAAIINIGQEGQLIFGALVGTWFALNVSGPAPLVIALVLAVSAIGGGLWAGIAALIRYTRGVDVVISTLLLNFVAFEIVSFAVGRAWLLQETTSKLQKRPQSDRIPDSLHLPRFGRFPDFNVSSGVLIGLGVLAIVVVALGRTRWGFRLRMLGLNPLAARRAGVSVAAIGGGALLLSGAFSGLAGGVMLTGTVFRMQPGFSQNVGFDGLLVALIAQRRAGWTVPVAFFFGALRAGGGLLAATGVPQYLVDVVQALLVLAALFPPVFLELRARRRALATARAAAREDDPTLEVAAA